MCVCVCARLHIHRGVCEGSANRWPSAGAQNCTDRPHPPSALAWSSRGAHVPALSYTALPPQDQASAPCPCWSLATVAHCTETNQVLTCLLPQGTLEFRCSCQALPAGLHGCCRRGQKGVGLCVPATIPLKALGLSLWDETRKERGMSR